MTHRTHKTPNLSTKQFRLLPGTALAKDQSWGSSGVPTLACRSPIPDDRTFTPGQRVLEGLEEVEDAPPNDHIVVQPNEEADLRARARVRSRRLQVKPPLPALHPRPSSSKPVLMEDVGGAGGMQRWSRGWGSAPIPPSFIWYSDSPQRNSWDIKIFSFKQ